MAEVIIYTKHGCPYCAAAREHYTKEGIPFKEINVHDIPGAKEEALKVSGGQNIVPIIVEDGAVKVGFGGG